MTTLRKVGFISGLALVAVLVAGQASNPQDRLPEPVRNGVGWDRVPVREGDPMSREQAQKMFEMRQAEIRRDTERMVQLSNELKEFVNSSGSAVLSIDMVKKAEAIEKLARNVKQKMKENR